MVRSYKFAILRLAPEGVREERINVGLAVVGDDGLDIRLPKRLDKIRVISASLTTAMIDDLAEAIDSRDLDLRLGGISDAEGRLAAIGRVGPITFSKLGTFSASSQNDYEARIAAITSSIIDPEPAGRLPKVKRSKVLSQLKRALRAERILARAEDTIDSHRVMPNLELADGLIADLVLKNGRMHVFETVDASAEDASPRKAVSDIAVSALVLEQARISFGERKTSARLIYEASSSVESAARSCLDAAAHQGAELYNWASTSDQIRLLTSISSLAIPYERGRRNIHSLPSGQPYLRLAR